MNRSQIVKCTSDVMKLFHWQQALPKSWNGPVIPMGKCIFLPEKKAEKTNFPSAGRDITGATRFTPFLGKIEHPVLEGSSSEDVTLQG